MAARPYTPPGFGWIFALLGLVLTIVFAALNRIDLIHAGLFLLAFLAMLV